MSLPWVLIIGISAGFVACKFTHATELSLVYNLIAGIVGGLLGGFIFSLLGFDWNIIAGSSIMAAIGAAIPLRIIFLFVKKKKMASA